jgi:hypothetical protein
MPDLKTTHQGPGNTTSADTPPGTRGENDRGDELSAREPGTAGTDHDLDRSGESRNQGHGHPCEGRRD